MFRLRDERECRVFSNLLGHSGVRTMVGEALAQGPCSSLKFASLGQSKIGTEDFHGTFRFAAPSGRSVMFRYTQQLAQQPPTMPPDTLACWRACQRQVGAMGAPAFTDIECYDYLAYIFDSLPVEAVAALELNDIAALSVSKDAINPDLLRLQLFYQSTTGAGSFVLTVEAWSLGAGAFSIPMVY